MDATPPSEIPDSNGSIKRKADAARVLLEVSAAMEAYFKGDGEFNLDLKELKLRILLDGPKWHGIVDKPVAQFLIDLEKKLRLEFEKLDIKLPKWERGLIALEVHEGSWDAILGYTNEAADFFQALAPSVRTVAAGAVMASVGAWASLRNRIQEVITPQEAQKAHDLAIAQDQQQALEAIEPEMIDPVASENEIPQEKIEALSKLETIQQDSPQLQNPIKTLLGLMTEGDTVVLPTEEDALKHKAAIQILEKTSRTPSRKKPTYYIDQHYTVQVLSTPKGPPSKWKVKIEYGGVSFSAGLSKISAQDLATLTSIYKDAFAKGGTPSADLRVTADFDEKGAPTSASVIGLGKPRENNVGLADAMAKAKDALQSSAK